MKPRLAALMTGLFVSLALDAASPEPLVRKRSDAPVIKSSWDDLLAGVESAAD